MKNSLLIVDDDPLILNTLKEKFGGWEMEVYGARDAEGARAVLEKVRPDLVILDLLLTSGDGAEGVLDYMQSQTHLAHVPVIILTNLDKPELKKLLLEQGVKEYLIKGTLSLDELYNKVVGYLSQPETTT